MRAAAQVEQHTAKLIGLMRNNMWRELHIGRSEGEVVVQVLEDYYSPKPYVAAKFDEPFENFERAALSIIDRAGVSYPGPAARSDGSLMMVGWFARADSAPPGIGGQRSVGGFVLGELHGSRKVVGPAPLAPHVAGVHCVLYDPVVIHQPAPR